MSSHYQQFLTARRQHRGRLVLLAGPGGQARTYDNHAIRAARQLGGQLRRIDGKQTVILQAAEIEKLEAAGVAVHIISAGPETAGEPG